jgi:hypothetical protein
MSSPKSIPRQVQFTPLTKAHFATDEGVAFVNLQLSEFARAINQGNGTAGQVVLKQGVDVAGSTVTGIGAPSGPSDAVSLGHASTNYGPEAVGPKLDLGGANSLKGLSALYLMVTTSGTGTVPLAKLTGGGSNGSITFKNGLIQSVVAPT